MRRLAILVTLVLTTAVAPLAALCGVDCGVQGHTAVHTPAADAACPLHEQPVTTDQHHECDHDHHVAPATAAKAHPAVASKDTAVGIVYLDQPAAIVADPDHHASHAHLRSFTPPPLRLFPLRV